MLAACSRGMGRSPISMLKGEKVMSMRSGGKTSLLVAVCTLAVMVLPAAARADTVTLSQDDGGFGIEFDPGGAAPADVYPSTINGPAGTVNDVNVRVQAVHAFLDDLDVALVSPNGTAVHIFSDACGGDVDGIQNLRFDDSAFSFLSDAGPCDQSQTYKVTNIFDPGPDPYPAPGPAGGTLNQLSFFNGEPSGGAWRLFATDDTTGNGGSITVWTMTLDYTPPSSGTAGSTVRSTPKKKCKKKKKKKRAAVAKKCKKKKKR
jgi:subtilisin-like proprotein convertase family protein